MTVASLNVVFAFIISALTIYIGWSHLRERGWNSPMALVGLAVITLSVMGVVTALPPALDIPVDEREPFRLVSGFLRGVVLVLLGGYALHRWKD